MQWDLLSLLSMPAILSLGIITSWEDIKSSIIRNKWIVAAVSYSLAILSGTVFLLWRSGQHISIGYLSQYAFNIFFGLAFSLLLWKLALWSAGDAKLFIAYTALVPLSFYSYSYMPYFPAFVIVVNTFILVLLFYLFLILYRSSRDAKKATFKRLLQPRFLAESMLFIFAFSWIAFQLEPILHHVFPFLPLIFFSILFLFCIWYLSEKIIKKSLFVPSIIVSVAAVLFDFALVSSSAYVSRYLILVALFILVRYILVNLSFEVFSDPTYIEDLKPGMLAAENFEIKKDNYTKRPIGALGLFSINAPPGIKLLFKSKASGLSPLEIKEVQKLHGMGRIKGHTIRIFQTVPFAPFLFIGVIVTLVAQGNLFLRIASLFI